MKESSELWMFTADSAGQESFQAQPLQKYVFLSRWIAS